MRFSFLNFFIKLTLTLFLSTLSARAHEVMPTIVDLSVENSVVSLDLQVNLEALLSGADLDGLADTDETDESDFYDELRGLAPGPLVLRTPPLLSRLNKQPIVTANGQPVILRSAQIDVPNDIDQSLPRVTNWRLVGELPDGTKEIELNWLKGGGQLVVRQQGVPSPYTGLLNGAQSSGAIALAGGAETLDWGPLIDYIPVGFDHILPLGLDHILFVIGLFLLSPRLSTLLWQVTMFTLAHSITLALAALDIVSVPGSIVEPLIAASIVYIAAENLFIAGLSKLRPLIVFGFGLLHGLGFASVLGEYGLPEGQFIYALIGFNIGVEIGQLTVIALMVLLIWAALKAAQSVSLWEDEVTVREYPVMFRAVSITGSILIGLVGIWWFIERVFL